MTQDFVPLAERIVDALLEVDPVLAGSAGDHRFDDRLPDLSAAGIDSDVALLRDASAALSQIDEDLLGAQERVDHAVLLARVERALFERTEIREHEWNPLVHNPGALIFDLIARPFAPADQRLLSVAARLAAIPDALATARSVLTDCPEVHLQTAIDQFTGTARLVRDELAGLVEQAPALAADVRPLRERAVAVREVFVGWLGDRLTDLAAGGGRDPRLGRRLWEGRLWHLLDTDMTAADLLASAEANLDRVGEELRSAAGGGDDAVRAMLDRLADDHPDDATIVGRAAAALAETTAFVDEHDLVTLIDDPLTIMEMPEFARGVAMAYCDPPGPLETADVPTFYCIAPAPGDWPAAQRRSFYREYNNSQVKNLTVHEAMPGHFLQLAHSRRFRGSTRARALGLSGSFVEGWAVYAEQVMVDLGFGGSAVRMQQLKMQLRMSINAIIDQRVHCDGMLESEAMALMTGRGFQEVGEAAGKWRRALLTCGQLSTYFAGWTEVSALAAERPAGVGVRAWHDRLLAHGSPPPRHVRTLLPTAG